MTYSLPVYSANVLSSDLSEDNNFRQWVSIVESGFLSSGWLEDTTDAGYCQQWLSNSAFGTVISYAAGVSTGTYAPSTYVGTPTYTPNNAFASATYSAGTYWQTSNQPVAGTTHYCLGYDSGTNIGTSTLLSYKLGFSAASNTDIYSWTVEGLTAASATNPDGNYDWAQSSWTCLDSHVGLVANSTGSITLASVPVNTVGSGYVINTTASISSSVHGVGAIIQPVVISNAIAGNIIVSAGIGYAVNDAVTYTTTSSISSAAVGYVSAVNNAGQITGIISTAGLGYGQNPIAVNSVVNTSSTTPVFGVFTNSAFGVAGGINSVIPAPFCSNTGVVTNPTSYATNNYGLPVISQSSGTGATCSSCTAIVQNTANTFNVPLPLSTTNTTYRAFRLRITANNGNTSYCYIYNWALYTLGNGGGTNFSITPARLAPTTMTGAQLVNFKIFYMNDSNASTCPCYCKVYFGSSGTWNYPAVQIAMGQGTDGAGNLVGPQATANMTVSTGTQATMAIAPFWINGYSAGTSSWLHLEMFKGGNTEMVLHIERLQTILGADDPNQGVALVCSTPYASFNTQSVIMPATGSSPGIETKLGSILGTNSGSVNGPVVQVAPVLCRNLGWSYPLKRLWVYETNSGITDGATDTITDSYGNSVSVWAGGKMCTSACQSGTNGRFLVKGVSS